MSKRYFICAGEKSGDILAASIINAAKALDPTIEFWGITGPEMQAVGCHSFASIDNLSVMGLAGVIKKLPFFINLKKKIVRFVQTKQFDGYIGVDFTEFNLSVEKKLKQLGVQTIHCKSPSVWAWRRGRLKKIKQAVDKMLLLFPFEKKIYQNAAIPATYIGHPLADLIALEPATQEARQQLNLAEDQKVIALLPGSRGQEISRLLPDFLAAANLLQKHYPECQFLLPVAAERYNDRIKAQCALYPSLNIHLLEGQSRLAMQASNLVILASGTATLEAMLLKKPMISCYRLAEWSYRLLKPLMYIDHYALPNILADKLIVPELIQSDLNADAIYQQAVKQLKRSDEEWLPAFTELHQSLRCNAAEEAAKAIMAV